MNILEARRLVNSSGFIDKNFFSFFSENIQRIYAGYCNKIDYEFSLNSKNLEIGFEYEPFYSFNSQFDGSEMKKKSFDFIYSHLKLLNTKEEKTFFNLEIIEKIFRFAFNSNLFLIHFGFEVLNRKTTKIKVYFIPIFNFIFSIRAPRLTELFKNQCDVMMRLLGFNNAGVSHLIDNSLNAFAVDFFPNGAFSFKIYQYYKKDEGFNKKNIGYENKLLPSFLKNPQINDTDILYRIQKHGSTYAISSKIYLYPKPPFSFRVIKKNTGIGIFKKVDIIRRKLKIGMLSPVIYSIGFNKEGAFDLYIR